MGSPRSPSPISTGRHRRGTRSATWRPVPTTPRSRTPATRTRSATASPPRRCPPRLTSAGVFEVAETGVASASIALKPQAAKKPVTGRIVTASGAGISDVYIVATLVTPNGGRKYADDALTNANGDYRLDLRPGTVAKPATFVLDVEDIHQRYGNVAPQVTVVPTTTSFAPITLAALQQWTYTGTVNSDDGQPVAGARVQIYSLNGVVNDFWSADPGPVTTTDANGKYTFTNLKHNAYYTVGASAYRHPERFLGGGTIVYKGTSRRATANLTMPLLSLPTTSGLQGTVRSPLGNAEERRRPGAPVGRRCGRVRGGRDRQDRRQRQLPRRRARRGLLRPPLRRELGSGPAAVRVARWLDADRSRVGQRVHRRRHRHRHREERRPRPAAGRERHHDHRHRRGAGGWHGHLLRLQRRDERVDAVRDGRHDRRRRVRRAGARHLDRDLPLHPRGIPDALPRRRRPAAHDPDPAEQQGDRRRRRPGPRHRGARAADALRHRHRHRRQEGPRRRHRHVVPLARQHLEAVRQSRRPPPTAPSTWAWPGTPM